jgi:hypothetical protein
MMGELTFEKQSNPYVVYYAVNINNIFSSKEILYCNKNISAFYATTKLTTPVWTSSIKSVLYNNKTDLPKPYDNSWINKNMIQRG